MTIRTVLLLLYAVGVCSSTNENYSQQDFYCLTKYAIDHNLLKLNDVQVNPNQINTTSVNCDEYVDGLKKKRETAMREEMDASSDSVAVGAETKDCTIAAYMRAFEYELALKVVENLNVTSEEKEPEVRRVKGKMKDAAYGSWYCYA